MASEDDGLAPTSMAETQNRLSPEFEESAQGKNKGHGVEVVEDNVPDMVRDDELKTVLRPTLEGTEEVDRYHFEKNWHGQNEKYSQRGDQHQEPDAFDRVDQEKAWSERLGRDRGQGRD